jgi:hypothetical protein
MKVLSTLATGAALLAASANALTSERSGLSAPDASAWAAFVEYAIEYEKEYRSFANDDGLVARRFAVRPPCSHLFVPPLHGTNPFFFIVLSPSIGL